MVHSMLPEAKMVVAMPFGGATDHKTQGSDLIMVFESRIGSFFGQI